MSSDDVISKTTITERQPDRTVPESPRARAAVDQLPDPGAISADALDALQAMAENLPQDATVPVVVSHLRAMLAIVAWFSRATLRVGSGSSNGWRIGRFVLLLWSQPLEDALLKRRCIGDLLLDLKAEIEDLKRTNDLLGVHAAQQEAESRSLRDKVRRSPFGAAIERCRRLAAIIGGGPK